MYWDRYIHRDNPRRIEPLDKPLDMYVMLDTETTGLHPEEGATLIEIGAFLVQPGNENSRPKFEQLIDPRQPLSEFIIGLTGITDQMLQGMPTAGAAMLRFHQWLDQVWPAGEPLTHRPQRRIRRQLPRRRRTRLRSDSKRIRLPVAMHEGNELGTQPAETAPSRDRPHRRLPHRRHRRTPRPRRRNPGADDLPGALP